MNASLIVLGKSFAKALTSGWTTMHNEIDDRNSGRQSGRQLSNAGELKLGQRIARVDFSALTLHKVIGTNYENNRKKAGSPEKQYPHFAFEPDETPCHRQAPRKFTFECTWGLRPCQPMTDSKPGIIMITTAKGTRIDVTSDLRQHPNYTNEEVNLDACSDWLCRFEETETYEEALRRELERLSRHQEAS